MVAVVLLSSKKSMWGKLTDIKSSAFEKKKTQRLVAMHLSAVSYREAI